MLKDAEHGVRSTTFFKWRCACWSTDVIVLDRSAGQSSKTDVGESRRGAAREGSLLRDHPVDAELAGSVGKTGCGPSQSQDCERDELSKAVDLAAELLWLRGGVQPAVLAAVAKRCNSRRAAQRSDTADPVVAPMRLAGGKPPGARR